MDNSARRFLPSISSLRAIEALDRLGSATAVADELSQTQGAVSRQLMALEAQLGVPLITREKKQMILTPAARTYAAEVRAALGQISRASMKISVNPKGGSLSLAVLPTFGMRWLVPRLADFSRKHPQITINLATRLNQFNFTSEGFDAAIIFAKSDQLDQPSILLKSETMIPVCAPEIARAATIAKPADLLTLPLMHIETRPDAWREWFGGYGVSVDRVSGTVYDQFTTIIQAALHGLGVALLPSYLAEPEIEAGRLIAVYGAARPTAGAYYLTWPKDGANHPALDAFRSWITLHAEVDDGLPR